MPNRQEKKMTGISRSPSRLEQQDYEHIVMDVRSDDYLPILESPLSSKDLFNLCIYCVGVGLGLSAPPTSDDGTIG